MLRQSIGFIRTHATLVSTLAGACIVLWLGGQIAPGAPLVALAFAPRPPRGEQESLWGEEPDPEPPTGDDPFDVALGRRDGQPLPNPLAGRLGDRPTAERTSGGRRAREAGADAPPRQGAAWGATVEDEPSGSPFRGLRLRVSRIVLLLIIAGMAASFLPVGDPPHGLAAILRPIFRDPFNPSSSPSLATIFFGLALAISVISSLRAILAVIGGTRAAAAIRRSVRKGAQSTPFDDGDNQGGLFAGVSLRELLLARRKRGDQ